MCERSTNLRSEQMLRIKLFFWHICVKMCERSINLIIIKVKAQNILSFFDICTKNVWKSTNLITMKIKAQNYHSRNNGPINISSGSKCTRLELVHRNGHRQFWQKRIWIHSHRPSFWAVSDFFCNAINFRDGDSGRQIKCFHRLHLVLGLAQHAK